MTFVWKKQLCIADENDMKTLENLEKEVLVDVFLEPNACPDFLVDRFTGQVTPQVKSVCINGTQWNLVPGKNRVPSSVYELLIASNTSLEKAQSRVSPRCIGRL